MTSKGEQELPSHAAFPTTSWTLIRQAQLAQSQERAALLNELLSLYWRPLYACYRAAGQSRQDAEDLVQGFLYDFVAKQNVDKISKQQARFRSWMRTCAMNHLRDRRRRASAQRRQPAARLLSLDELKTKTGAAYEVSGLDPVATFDDAWRRDLLQRALQAVEQECRLSERVEDFRIFLEYYCSPKSRQHSWKDLAQRHGLDEWKVAARKADWIKGRLAKEIRREVRTYVDSEPEVEDEIRELLD